MLCGKAILPAGCAADPDEENKKNRKEVRIKVKVRSEYMIGEL